MDYETAKARAVGLYLKRACKCVEVVDEAIEIDGVPLGKIVNEAPIPSSNFDLDQRHCWKTFFASFNDSWRAAQQHNNLEVSHEQH